MTKSPALFGSARYQSSLAPEDCKEKVAKTAEYLEPCNLARILLVVVFFCAPTAQLQGMEPAPCKIRIRENLPTPYQPWNAG